MKNTFKLVKVDSSYCDYLRRFDNKVPYNKGLKELRPFVGILFTIHECEFFAPLTSPKAKHLKMHDTLDFYKIDEGRLGAINFNNMIPVTEKNYELLTLNQKTEDTTEEKYYELLRNQLAWLNEHYIQIRKNSRILYRLYNTKKLPTNVMSRCCNFKLLESKCREYSTISV